MAHDASTMEEAEAASVAVAFSLDNPTPLEWTSERNQVLVNGRPFRIKGLNWFGFETEVRKLVIGVLDEVIELRP